MQNNTLFRLFCVSVSGVWCWLLLIFGKCKFAEVIPLIDVLKLM